MSALEAEVRAAVRAEFATILAEMRAIAATMHTHGIAPTPEQAPTKLFASVGEVAAIYGVSSKTLRKLIAERRITERRIGTAVRLCVAEVDLVLSTPPAPSNVVDLATRRGSK